jgi:hypothetical protein
VTELIRSVQCACRAVVVVGVVTALLFVGGVGRGLGANQVPTVSISLVSQTGGDGQMGRSSTSVWRVTNTGSAPTFGIVKVSIPDRNAPSPRVSIIGPRGPCGTATYGCELPVLAPGESIDLSVDCAAFAVFTAGSSASVPTTMTVSFAAETDPNDPSLTVSILNSLPANLPSPHPSPPGQGTLPVRPLSTVQMNTVATPQAATVVVGDTANVHFAITNVGTAGAENYGFNPQVSGPAALVSATTSAGTCSQDNGMICAFPRVLTAGASLPVDIVVRPTAPGSIAIHAVWVALPFATPLWPWFFSSGGDTTLTAVARETQLSTSIARPTKQVVAGKPFMVRVVVTNHGPHTAPVAATTFTSQGLAIVSVKATGATCSSHTRCTFTNALANAAAIYTLTLRAPTRGTKRLTATTGTLNDPTPDDNTETVAITVKRTR